MSDADKESALGQHEQRLAAEELLEPTGIEIDWVEPYKGILSACPDAAQHDKEDNRPVTIFLDWNPAPVIHCFHDNCKPERDRLGTRLRARLLGQDFEYKPKYTAEQTERWRSLKRVTAFARLNFKPDWLAKPAFAEARWAQLSPVKIPADGCGQLKLFLRSMFPSDAVVWFGEKWQTGYTKAEKGLIERTETQKWFYQRNGSLPKQERENSYRFRTVEGWLAIPDKYRDACGPFVSPAAFYDGCWNRTKGYAKRCYLVLENDTLPVEQFGNVQWELNDNYRLAAVIASGKKSWHAWYPLPDDQREREYFWALLKGLAADMQTAKHNLAVRAPGWIRAETKRMQKLLYLNPVYTV